MSDHWDEADLRERANNAAVDRIPEIPHRSTALT
jgi:hypothetical protein